MTSAYYSSAQNRFSQRYLYLCLHADRRTGQLCDEQTRLAMAVGKSRRSVVTYLEELRQRGVCSIHAAVNQHVGGQIEICDAFWPYDRVQPSTSADTLPAFIEQTKRLLAARRCIGTTF